MRSVKQLFLFFKHLGKISTQKRKPSLNQAQQIFNMVLREHEDDKYHLKMSLDDSFANSSSREEYCEGNSEVSASNSCKIEERVRNRSAEKNSDKSMFLKIIIDKSLHNAHEIFIIFMGFDILKFIYLLFAFSSCLCYKVRGKFSNSSSKSP